MKITRQFIADKAKVSPTTVSDVVNANPKARISDAVKKKVLAVAEKYNYSPNATARALVSGKTGDIGFVYRASLLDFINDPFTHEIFAGLVGELEKNDCGLLFSMLKDDNINSSVKKMFCGGRVDGLIFNGYVGEKIINFLRKTTIPFVVIDFLIDNLAHSAVLPANYEGAMDATEYLIANKLKKIVAVNGEVASYPHPSYVERLAGYKDAMKNASLLPSVITTLPDLENAEKTVTDFLHRKGVPDAFFATGDHMAIGTLRAVEKFDSQLLEKIRIIGFDDISWCSKNTPALSSVSVPKIEMGKKAVQLLLNSINKKTNENKILRLPTKLIIRNT